MRRTRIERGQHGWMVIAIDRQGRAVESASVTSELAARRCQRVYRRTGAFFLSGKEAAK